MRRDVWKPYPGSCSQAVQSSHSAEASRVLVVPQASVSRLLEVTGHSAQPAWPSPRRPYAVPAWLGAGGLIMLGAHGRTPRYFFKKQNLGWFRCRRAP